jgi:FixJ family two-component response regulator
MPAKRKVVAVIDDNLGILGAMSRLLSAFGYATELYASAEEFHDVAMRTEAICLIVDIQLGESCGIEFAQQLANAGFTMPIIFMTADDNESVKRRAMELGCRAFLRKPFSADALIGALVNLPPRSAVSIPRSRSETLSRGPDGFARRSIL